MQSFAQLLRDGVLSAGFTDLGGGSVHPMPKDWWFTTDPLLRFRTWSIDPKDPFNNAVELPCWIWVEQKGLGALLEQMGRDFNNWGPVFDEQAWLASQPTYDEPTGAGRPSKTAHILKMFRDRVGRDEVLERVAWEGKAIHEADAGNSGRATAKTCEDRIRKYYNQIQRTQNGKIANKGAMLKVLDEAINSF